MRGDIWYIIGTNNDTHIIESKQENFTMDEYFLQSTSRTPPRNNKNTKPRDLQEIVGIIREHYPAIQQKYNIAEISIVGSYARQEQTDKSDLDILVEFNEPIGWEVVDLKDDLEKICGIQVDLILKAGVIQRKQVYAGILEDAVYVKA